MPRRLRPTIAGFRFGIGWQAGQNRNTGTGPAPHDMPDQLKAQIVPGHIVGRGIDFHDQIAQAFFGAVQPAMGTRPTRAAARST